MASRGQLRLAAEAAIDRPQSGQMFFTVRQHLRSDRRPLSSRWGAA
jgi:hypothetical protein